MCLKLIYSVLLGLIQGVAEFLPISSSGHLALFENLFGMEALQELDNSALFNVLLHFGTLVAVFVFYWRDICAMAGQIGPLVRALCTDRGNPAEGRVPRRQLLLIILATLPLFVVAIFHSALEALNGKPLFIGCMLLITGLLLWLADRAKPGKKHAGNITGRDALLIGCAQALAVLPGLSRSGTTITAGVFRGLERPYAVRFSFLMSILSVLGAVVLKLLDVIGGETVNLSLLPFYFVGMAVAGVTGYFSLHLLKKVADKGRFGGFAYYCWGVGALTVFLTVVLR